MKMYLQQKLLLKKLEPNKIFQSFYFNSIR